VCEAWAFCFDENEGNTITFDRRKQRLTAAISSMEGGKFSQKELMTSNWTDIRDFKSDSKAACTLCSSLDEFIQFRMLKRCPGWSAVSTTDSLPDMDIGGKTSSRHPSAEYNEAGASGAGPPISRHSKTYDDDKLKVQTKTRELLTHTWRSTNLVRLLEGSASATLSDSMTLTLSRLILCIFSFELFSFSWWQWETLQW